MKTALAVALAAAAGFSTQAPAQAKEQFVPVNSYWVGPYAPGGSGIAAGMIDYFKLLNARDRGINGVRITWEKCETEYRNDRGVECYERSKNKGPTGATLIHPLSTGITYSLIEKGTTDKIPIVSIGYGRTDASDGRVFPYVFPLMTNYWSQNTAKINIIGVWWSGAEEDVIPAGEAAKGYIAAGFNAPGADHVVIREIQKHVYAKGQGELEDKSRLGTIYYNRGVLWGILTTEAVRKAQERFGKGKPMTGEQVRWGLENLNIDDKRLKELGAVGFMQPLKVSCMDHEGGGAVKFQQWDGGQWKVLTDWIASDQSIVRPMIEASAAQYAQEKGIARRDCSTEK